MKLVSSMQEIVQIIISLFEWLKKKNNDIISDVYDLWEETNVLISDLNVDIWTLEIKVDSLNVELDNNNQYEHGDELIISGDIISDMVFQLKTVKIFFLIYSVNI